MKIKRKYVLMILAVISSVWIYYGIVLQNKTKYQDFINFNWMSGDWYMRSNGYTIYEHWDGKSEAVMEGFSVTTNEKGDTVGREELRIIKLDEEYFYIAKPRSKSTTTTFKMVLDSIRKVRFYNATNDFPKWIEYTRKDDSLIAKISNKEREIYFRYKSE